jgi:hypothetical protein
MVRTRLQALTCVLLPCVLSVASYAQQPSTQDPPTSTTASAAAPASGALPPSERVVLKVGNVQLTQAQFEAIVKVLEAQQGPADLSKRTIGENYASLLMLAQQAVAHHLDSTPDVIRQLAIDRNQILSNAEFASLRAQAKPTPEEISAYYAAHGDDYDMVAVRRIFIWKKIKDSSTPTMSSADAHALADAIRQAYAPGSDPNKLIRDSNHVVLDAQPLSFQRGDLPGRMAKAFTMKEGEWTVVDDTPDTLVMLQLVKRSRLSLKETSPFIEKKLQGEKLQAKLDSLKKQNGVWLDQDYFAPGRPVPGSSAQSQNSGPTNSVQKEKDEDKRQ